MLRPPPTDSGSSKRTWARRGVDRSCSGTDIPVPSSISQRRPEQVLFFCRGRSAFAHGKLRANTATANPRTLQAVRCATRRSRWISGLNVLRPTLTTGLPTDLAITNDTISKSKGGTSRRISGHSVRSAAGTRFLSRPHARAVPARRDRTSPLHVRESCVKLFLPYRKWNRAVAARQRVGWGAAIVTCDFAQAPSILISVLLPPARLATYINSSHARTSSSNS